MGEHSAPGPYAAGSRATAPSAGSLWLWALSGLVAGLTLSGAMLGLRLLTGVPSLPEVVQDRLLEILPGQLVGSLIDHLQFAAKPFLLVGWVAGQTAAGVLLGVLVGVVADRRRVRRDPGLVALHGLIVGAAFWLATELLALPALGVGPLGVTVREGVRSAAWSLAAFVLYGLVLVGFRRLLAPRPLAQGSGDTELRRSVSRRHVIAVCMAGGAAAFAGATLWRIVQQLGEHGTPTVRATSSGAQAPQAAARSAAPASAALAPVDTAPATPAAASPIAAATRPPASATPAPVFTAPNGISLEITPNDQFYVVTKNLVDPVVRADGWALDVAGMVNQTRRFSYQDLLGLPASDQFTTLECISNLVGGNLISNTRWTGVPLAMLLDQVGVQDEAAWVVFTSADNYKESLPLDAARQPHTLLAYHMNGSPIADKHGFPLRLLTTGLYGMKNPKWLNRIELAAQAPTGTWERSGWKPDRGVETMARFDTRPEQVPAGVPVLLGGIAFTGDRGVLRVEVSADAGGSWSPASLKPPLSPFTWVLWSYRWIPPSAGDYTLQVRATDGAGTPQTAQKKLSYSTGATGLHTIQVQVV
ncbi:MAG TPA: molybdopterin-dependent oxidoreductase [Dehalococcoidia bacterium]|nr:molybdopterin-dependent oxidoreductase [Dehalococcoidia bacterium]